MVKKKQQLNRVKKKQPITANILKRLCLRFGCHKANLAELRFLAMSLLSLAGFLRFDEVSKIHICDVTIGKQHIEITIPSSKTDVYRSGKSVIIAKAHQLTCPVDNLQNFLRRANIVLSRDCNLYMFRRLQKEKRWGRALNDKNIPVSYTRAREDLTLAGFDSHSYGLHSFRSGCATAAANNGGIDRLFKRHGRWRSETAKDFCTG